MRRSEVSDEWAEDDGVDALGERDHRRDGAEERCRRELGMDQRRRQYGEERNRKDPARRREHPSSAHSLEETGDGELCERDKEGVEDEHEPDRTRTGTRMRFHERRQNIRE